MNSEPNHEPTTESEISNTEETESDLDDLEINSDDSICSCGAIDSDDDM